MVLELAQLRWDSIFRKHKQEIISRPVAEWRDYLSALQKGVSELRVEEISAKDVISELSTKSGSVSQLDCFAKVTS